MQHYSECQSLLHPWPDLSFQRVLFYPIRSNLQWCLYRSHIFFVYLPELLHSWYFPSLGVSLLLANKQTATGGYITRCEGSTVRNGTFCCSTDINGTCCDDANNKLYIAPPSSFAIAVIPALATAAASNTKATTSSTGLLSSTTPSSTLRSTQASLSSTLPTTAITSTPKPTPTPTGKMEKVGIGLGVGFGVGAIIVLLWGLYAYYCRKRRQERFHKYLARCRFDAWNKADKDFSRRWGNPFTRREPPANGEQDVRSSADSAKSESVPTTVSTFASSERQPESQPPSELRTESPNSQIERVVLDTDSAVDREPTAELESETFESEMHDGTSPQPNTSNRSETLTSAQLDGTSSQSPDTDRVATRVSTPEEGLKSHEPTPNDGTSPATPAESLQVEAEIQRQWSWQHGDDEHLQRSLEEQIELPQ